MLNDLNRIDDENKNNSRKSANLLPVLFRTDKNSKFLSGTIDQLIQPPKLKRIEGWVGSRVTPTNTGDDIYLSATSKLRQDYQLEPSLIINDDAGNLVKTTSYDDFINQLAYEGAQTSRLDRLLTPDFYSYNPRIDWDKFVNFEKYYWLPFGPDAVSISNQQKELVSTYNVSDTADGFYFIFTPDGLTPAPQITLYRGVTYKFNINSKNPFWIKTVRIDGTEAAFRAAENNGVNSGTITLTIDFTTPQTLYFVSENDKLNGGEFIIKDIDENTAIDVEKEILGKVDYTSYNGVKFTNGLKVKFNGEVSPEFYKDKEFIVEGVGTAIKLVDFSSLETPEAYANSFDERFDTTLFDASSFDQSSNVPLVPEYVTINRSSIDRNYWSRYNRWFHEDVVKTAATANKVEPDLNPLARAKRPIIEFEANLKLYNFGSFAKPNVQYIDTITPDAFSEVEGQLGYYVDGVELGHGDRVIFLSDTDPYVRGKTYYVNFVNIKGEFRISLEEAEDFEPQTNDSILVTSGTRYQGTHWWFDGKEWQQSQEKTSLNQFPRFDVFDDSGLSYSDQTVYKNGTFRGTNIFGYSIGTGSVDPVLGFSLKYRNVANQAYYLFENYFSKDINLVIDGNNKFEIPVEVGFLKKVLSRDNSQMVNIWEKAVDYRVPIIQYNVINEEVNEIEITSVKDAGYQSLDIEVFVNNVKQQIQDHYTVYSSSRRYFVVFKDALEKTSNVLFKIRTDGVPSETGFYETSLGWVNNPLNKSFVDFTLSEIAEHVKSMADRHPLFLGTFPGNNNIRDINNLSSYGTRLIVNRNSPAFASYFIANDQFNVLSSIRTVAQHYNQFKLSLLDQISKLGGNYTSRRALDIALYNINVNKEVSFPYSLTDMIPYGTDALTRNYTVTDSRNVVYSLVQSFDNTVLSTRAVIIYHTNSQGIIQQLVHGKDYEFNKFDPSFTVKIPLEKGDIITVDDYASTEGCYVPPTPTKLGLYPKYEPKIFVDDSYIEPQTVIQGHDGSLMIAFGDYRDNIILEFEKRVYNNLKISYNPELMNITQYVPGAFRQNRYTSKEINRLISKDFLKWTSFYGFDFFKNDAQLDNSKTWNFKSAKNTLTRVPISGNWRAIFKYFYDTDRPHTHPWEMLGISEMPGWWEDQYGPTPYTSGNKILWTDLESGTIRDPLNTRISSLYARPGLSKIIPVDEHGDLLKPEQANLVVDIDYQTISDKWSFGDHGPVETAWRRSSYWPFAAQIMLALADPLCYSSKMFDVSRLRKNPAGQFVYTKTNKFISLQNLDFYSKNNNLAAGYSVMLIEAGKQKNKNYITDLESELKNSSFNLSYKVGGFINKEKFKIIIDSVSPTSANAGVSISNEDYLVFLDKSSPVKSVGVSGVIIERTRNGYSIRGYDVRDPYFTVFMPVFTSTDPAFNVGGKREPFVDWAPSAGNSATGIDLTSVSSNTGFRFYKQGQIVRYLDRYYRVKVGHNSGSEFVLANFQPLPELPLTGGVTVRKPSRFDRIETQIPYGTEFTSEEDVYAVLIGYGEWLKSQGAVFDQYNKELGEIFDWFYSSKEFLFWSTQGWTAGSVITLSPFAEQLKFVDSTAVVDNIANPFYEYSVLKADGAPLSIQNISTSREEEQFVIATKNTTDGIYFVRLNLIQKEHTIVLNNRTLFNDVIYDNLTGYKQRRIKLIGFITDGWNGDIFSPGFIYDEAKISTWTQYQNYSIGEVVLYAGNYYSANEKIVGSEQFNFNQWNILGKKPVAELLPNFDYKINEFENFYSLDIDNFDQTQQDLAQRLTGYTRRIYLDNIFINPTTQYKFYQGYIREKGTKNTIDKLGKASVISLGSFIDLYEDWAFRVGNYGSFETNKELEFDLKEEDFKENPQIFYIGSEDQGKFISVKNTNNLLRKVGDNLQEIFPVTDLTHQNKLPVAGYIKLDDVTATAFNKDSLLDIANNRNILEGSTFWVGFEANGDWGVYRYTKSSMVVSNVEISIPGEEILITTDIPHNLLTGDIISISQFDVAVDGIYEIANLVSRNQFTVKSVLSELTLPFVPAVGLVFKFVKVRFKNIHDIQNFIEISKLRSGEKIWVDDINGKWVTLEKKDLEDRIIVNRSDDNTSMNQQFGYTVSTDISGNRIAVSAPSFVDNTDYGKVYLYNASLRIPVFVGSLLINPSPSTTFFNGVANPMYGTSIKIGDVTGYVVSSAPNAGNVKWGDEVEQFKSVITENSASSNTNEGLVKFNKINFNRSAKINDYAFASPEPQTNANFGFDIALREINENQFVTFVSAPGYNNIGEVYFTKFTNTEENTLVVEDTNFYKIGSAKPALTSGSMFGYSISLSKENNLLAVSAPGISKVYVYSIDNNLSPTLLQTLPADNLGIISTDKFGTKVVLDSTGTYLYVSAPFAFTSMGKTGKVFVYKNNGNNVFEINQIIDNPLFDNSYNFGLDLALNPKETSLAVSAMGMSVSPNATFDTYKSRLGSSYTLDSASGLRPSSTTFDSGLTFFNTQVDGAGIVAVFERIVEDQPLIFADAITGSTGDELINDDFRRVELQQFGKSTAFNNKGIVVGAPGPSTESDEVGYFDLIERRNNLLQISETQDNLVDLDKIKNVKIIDIDNDQVTDYLEIVDPINGKIVGIAEQEIRYKTLFDPAIYSLGVAGLSVNSNSAWLDEHVGELWWDLSTVKFVNYNQGDLEFRRNNWNKMFPGSMIDIYEWVKTPLLPTQWAEIADTNQGITQGISGQPKFVDNSAVSVKQVWNPTSNSFSNVYYYWVKNKTTVPESRDRNISAYDVATLIADPKSQGIKFVGIIDQNALMVTNVEPSSIVGSMSLSVEIDTINNKNNKHTEWMLIQDGNPTNQPPKNILEKVIDSLVGQDKVGNIIPDPALSVRERYGVEFRPKQTMFKNREGALRTFAEYTNSILEVNNIIGSVDISKLFEKEEIPNLIFGEYDLVVEDLIERDFVIKTKNLRRAELACEILDGKLFSVRIVNPGFGYGKLYQLTETTWKGPVVKVEGDGVDARVETEVNTLGQVVSAKIVSVGQRFTTRPTLTVRAHAYIVTSDETVGGRWSKYEWDQLSEEYVRIYTQSYNTQDFWEYADWVDSEYNNAQDIIATIDAPFQLPALSNILTGNYVKVRNIGDGRFAILRKVSADRTGTYNFDYDIVYQEKGTFQIKNSLWNFSQSFYGWDQEAGWDQTSFDQTPSIELLNIIRCIFENIFVGNLKVYKNKLFFKLVKYAISEQKFVDWALKTAFINVTNYAGQLDQRPVYKLNNETYYQSYVDEVKPYHTKVRNFAVNYTATDVTSSVITDFDLPSYYDVNKKQFVPVTFGNNNLLGYPWRSWFENYSYGVDSIVVYDGGEGYQLPPDVEIVAQPGDTGFGAKAVAYIALGKVSQIIVTDPGVGYTVTPVVNLIGGGSTTLTPAKVSVRLSNNKIRTNKVTIKFDRVSGYDEVTTPVAVDRFISDGITNKFKLTWAPNTDKTFSTVKINGVREISSNYELLGYTEKYRGYSKKFGELVLNRVYPAGAVITIEYRKDLRLYNAIDRIRDYYQPTAGMPGNTATLLMNGLEYPGVTLDTLPFEVSKGWDSTPFGSTNWDDFIPEVGYFATIGSTSTFRLPYVPAENQRINVYINGTRVDGIGTVDTLVGDGFTNEFNIGTSTQVTDLVEFRLESSDGTSPFVDPDLDTFISGGGFATINGRYDVTKSNDYEDINIDGDGLVTTNNSYGPEENLPGKVSDTLGMNIFTYPESGTALVVNKKYIKDPAITRYSIGYRPASLASVEVMLDNKLLTNGVEYLVDYSTNEIELEVDPFLGIRGPYFSPEDALPGKQGTAIASTAGDDTFTGPYPLGFQWNMFGTVYDQVYVGTNGYLTFGGGSSKFSPLVLGEIEFPAIYVKYTDLWQALGVGNTPLSTGETPGLYLSEGTVGKFNFWKMRFVGTHYNRRNQKPTVPAYQYEVTLFSDGVNQYVEMIYENTWKSANFNGDLGFITGIARGKQGTVPGTGVQVSYEDILNNTSHVFYSTSNGGNWQYAGRGSFDPFRNPLDLPPGALSLDSATVITVIDECSDPAELIEDDWLNFRKHYPNRRFCLLQPQGNLYTFDDIKVPSTFNNSFRATGPVAVNRDEGNTSQISDWFELCGLGSLRPGSIVALAIDISGSMNLGTVQASYNFFKSRIAEANLVLVEYEMLNERWAFIHDRELPTAAITNQPQVLSITSFDVGGKNLLEKSSFEVSAMLGLNNFELSSNVFDIKSSYVTVNGAKITDYEFVGKQVSTGRAVLKFDTNLTLGDIVQVWLFAADHKAFSEIEEQIFPLTTSTNQVTLNAVPGNIAPLHSQIIVEKSGVRLLPPDTVYYRVEAGNRVFSLGQHYDYPQGLPDRRTVEVYVNGIRKSFGKSIKLLQNQNAVEFSQAAVKDGDVIAITVLRDHDYYVDQNKLILTDKVNINQDDVLKVTTFTNHDSSLIRRERFPGNSAGIFNLSRTAIGINYVWVEVNGRPLTSGTEYNLAKEGKAVVLNDSFKLSSSDTVVIMSVSDQINKDLLGFRIFYDNLGRAHYKRLSENYSTRLAADLYDTDKVITVEDSSVLSKPNVDKNKPGIILINGERIEFFKVEGNKLSMLRRGTLGTGVKSMHKESSIVIDQGQKQTIPVYQNMQVWKQRTAFWNTGTDLMHYGTSTYDISSNFDIESSDELDVYYEGRLLRKPTSATYEITDTSIAYDSYEINSQGVNSTIELDSEYTITGGILEFNFLPKVNSEIKIVKRTAQEVGIEDYKLHNIKAAQVNFLLDQPSFAPDKYYYGQNQDTRQVWVSEAGDTIDDESGSPIIGS